MLPEVLNRCLRLFLPWALFITEFINIAGGKWFCVELSIEVVA